jgi:hypothetical protein
MQAPCPAKATEASEAEELYQEGQDSAPWSYNRASRIARRT